MNHVSRVRRVPLGNDPIRIGKAIGYGYLSIEHAQPGTAVEFEFFGEWVRGGSRLSAVLAK